MTSEDEGAQDLMDIKGFPTYVIDIWSDIMSVGIACGIRELQWREYIIGLRPMSVGDIWSGSMLVWDIWVSIDVS